MATRGAWLSGPHDCHRLKNGPGRSERAPRRAHIGALLNLDSPACFPLLKPRRFSPQLVRRLGRGLGTQRGADVVDELLDEFAIIPLAHDADDGLGAGGADDQPPLCRAGALRFRSHARRPSLDVSALALCEKRTFFRICGSGSKQMADFADAAGSSA